MKNSLILFFLLIFLSCSQTSEWISLFDGKNVKGLRGYKMANGIILLGSLTSSPRVAILPYPVYATNNSAVASSTPSGAN